MDIHGYPQKIAQLKLISILYSSLLTKQPDYRYRLISLHTAPRHIRSSNYTVLTEPSYRRKKLRKRCYSVCTSLLWNLLPTSLKTIIHQRPLSNINKEVKPCSRYLNFKYIRFATLYTCLY